MKVIDKNLLKGSPAEYSPTFMINPASPIGIFDSGLGGLTVVREIIRALPAEHLVYFGDTARVPYGVKSPEAIRRFSQQNTSILLEYGVKMVVVACNSSASYALTDLRKNFKIPILGVIDPGVRQALAVTRTGRVGVIATEATIRSGAYARKLMEADAGIQVFDQSCPLFVPLVEEGRISGVVTETVAREYLRPLKRAKVDTMILGCTHYPLLKKVLRRVMGPEVTLVDSARAVAQRVKESLVEADGLRQGTVGRRKFIISDVPRNFDRVAGCFLGEPVRAVVRRF
jgi:glutamate racemase